MSAPLQHRVSNDRAGICMDWLACQTLVERIQLRSHGGIEIEGADRILGGTSELAQIERHTSLGALAPADLVLKVRQSARHGLAQCGNDFQRLLGKGQSDSVGHSLVEVVTRRGVNRLGD